MVRKLLFWGGGGLLLVGLVGGTAAKSYVKTVAKDVSSALHDAVPVEFEIERAKTMVADLKPEIRKNMHLIAREEVNVQQLEKQIGKIETGMAQSQADIVRLRGDLENGNSVYVYAGRQYDREHVRNDLAARFASHKVKQDTLENLKKIHAARTQGLAAARAKLDEMLTAKKQLEVDVEKLEAQLRMVELAETTSEYKFDDSHLGRVRELIQDVQTRLDVSRKLAEAAVEPVGQIQLDAPADTSIEDTVAEYFGLDDSAGQVALEKK
jgi:chromosome segregation ATPase